jgi:hypothetical protein
VSHCGCGCQAGILEDEAHPPLSRTQANVALEANTSSGAGSSSSVGPYPSDAPDLGLDTTSNVIKELGLSQFHDEAPLAPT